MIDLTQTQSASPLVRTVVTDPGTLWTKDTTPVIEAPSDTDSDPQPEARWSANAPRTGICGAVSPRVIALPDGGYRMYYTQILPRSGFPAGANDYEYSGTRILSAFSTDGNIWDPEPGVRLSPEAVDPNAWRVVSSEVVPVADGRRLRMYYECCAGPQTMDNSIRSAVSSDGGLEWTPEPGSRIECDGCHYSAPRIVFLSDGRVRLYCAQNGRGIISAVSDEDGLVFHEEPGVRLGPDGTWDSLTAFAPEIVRVQNAGYVMYYAGYSQATRAYILRAVSDDGLTWRKDTDPVISPGPGGWDAAKCSEMCVLRLSPASETAPRYRMLYEACDGTTTNERGVWRILGATSQ